MIADEWRVVPGFDGWYEVSNRGRVRSWRTRAKSCTRASAPRDLECAAHVTGYVRAKLTHPVLGKLTVFVHQLVLAAFVGPRPEGMVCDHMNAVRNDNRPDNLRWVTSAENIRHAASLGRMNGRPGGCAQSPLTEEAVAEIRRLRAGGLKRADLAARFGVCERTISRIALGHSWKAEVA